MGVHEPEHAAATPEKFLLASRHTLDLATGAVQSLVGLGGRPAIGPAVGTAGVVALIAVITLRLVLPPRTDRLRVLAIVGTLAVYWTLLWWGRNNMTNLPLQPRYLFITQVLMLLLMVELFARGRTTADGPGEEPAASASAHRPAWLLAGTAVLTVALLVASVPHLGTMRAGARKLRTESDQMRAQIVALSLLPTAERQNAPLFREARTRQLAAPAGPYFAQDGRFGIPLRTERDVQELRPVERAHLDGFLLGLTAAPAQLGVPMPEPSGVAPMADARQVTRAPGASACRRVVGSGGQPVSFTLAPGQWITVQSGPAAPSRLQLHRYAPSGVPITTMELPAGSLYNGASPAVCWPRSHPVADRKRGCHPVHARHGMSRSVVVTGGAGFVGSSVALALAERHPDWQILVVDNLYRRGSELNLPRLKAAGIRFQHGDIRVADDLQRSHRSTRSSSARRSLRSGPTAICSCR